MDTNAFIISPIGAPSSDIRNHADWVRRELIEKACQRLHDQGQSITAIRSDDNIDFAHITDEVIERIVEDRVVFVVLGGNRPNCYFELGLTIAAGRPAIILRHDEEHEQFDTNDYRAALVYTLPADLSAPAPDADIERVTRALRNILKQPRHFPSVHGKYDPLGKNFMEWEMLAEFRKIDFESYSKFFDAATQRICLQGISLEYFTNANTRYHTQEGKASFFDFIRGKMLFDACDIHVVIMHEDNPALPQLHRLDRRTTLNDEVEKTRKEIKRSLHEWSRLKDEISRAHASREDGKKGAVHVHQIRHGVVHYRLSCTEKELILSPYINTSGINSDGPAIRVTSTTSFYQQIMKEYDDLIKQNAPPDAEADTANRFRPPSDSSGSRG